uniref:Uncharacterized protein n=1 Tax=Picea glauca TaxID=3330 RepID=A0A101M488_PICGL|nr:hypothetical protein ABT39_MTgene554 [Picea glauca]QHR89390.1 hypothetical protein Q903MT_gene3411 [Picea sitchensis]
MVRSLRMHDPISVIQERLISLNERDLFARYKQPSSVECSLCMHPSDAIIKSLRNRLAVLLYTHYALSLLR